jgi:phage-related tail protein
MAQSQLVEVRTRCEKLQKENQEYQAACDKMQKEYADKMAELCRREEEAKKQVSLTFLHPVRIRLSPTTNALDCHMGANVH